jgi:hypothetical protein
MEDDKPNDIEEQWAVDDPHLWDGMVGSVSAYARGQANYYPSEQWLTIINTIERIVPELVQQAERLGAPQKAFGFCSEAMKIIRDLVDAIHGEEPRNGTQMLWSHRQDPTMKIGLPFLGKPADADERFIDKEALQGVAARYLTREWHSDHIEWCIVDALVLLEFDAFIRLHLRSEVASRRFFLAVYAAVGAMVVWPHNNLWTWWRAGFVGLIALLPIFSSRLWQITYVALLGLLYWLFPPTAADDLVQQNQSMAAQNTLIWAAIVLVALFVIDGRSLIEFKHRRALRALKAAYYELKGAVLSPVRVRDQLRAAEKDGVVWPTAVWPVLDAAIARNPAVWKVWGSR